MWRLDVALDLLGAAHPGLWADTLHPIGKGRDEAEILDDMLLADPARRDDAAGRQGDGRTEDGLGQEDAFGVVAERAVPEIRGDRLAGIEPAMDRQVIFDRARPISSRRRANGDTDVPSLPPSEHMLGVFGGFDPLIEVERDRPVADVEEKIAVGALVDLPSAIGLLEEIVDQLLDRILDRQGFADDGWAAPSDPCNLDVDEPKICVSAFAVDDGPSICPLSA